MATEQPPRGHQGKRAKRGTGSQASSSWLLAWVGAVLGLVGGAVQLLKPIMPIMAFGGVSLALLVEAALGLAAMGAVVVMGAVFVWRRDLPRAGGLLIAIGLLAVLVDAGGGGSPPGVIPGVVILAGGVLARFAARRDPARRPSQRPGVTSSVAGSPVGAVVGWWGVVARLSATVGGVLWVAAFPVLLSFLNRDSSNMIAWAAFVLSCVLLIVGLLGLHARQADRMRLVGPAGLFACVFALVFLPLVLFFFHIVALLLALGAAVYGIATIRAQVLPQGGAWLLTLGGLPFLAVGLVNMLGVSVALALCNVEQGFDRVLTPSEVRCTDRVAQVEGWLLIGFAVAFGLGVTWLAWGRRATRNDSWTRAPRQ